MNADITVNIYIQKFIKRPDEHKEELQLKAMQSALVGSSQLSSD